MGFIVLVWDLKSMVFSKVVSFSERETLAVELSRGEGEVLGWSFGVEGLKPLERVSLQRCV